jgi:hypothetical protein
MKVLVGIAILIGACFVAWLAYPASNRTVTITDFSAPTEISVRAPIRPFGSGAMFVMYEGTIASDAKIEVTSNRRRDMHTIELQKGQVNGIYGGAEEWVDDLSISFLPSFPAAGEIKIGLYCGSGFPEADREWYNRLSRR